jgi:hypothetical protein
LNSAFEIISRSVSEPTGDLTSSPASLVFNAQIRNGAGPGVTSLSSSGNIAAFQNNGANQVLVRADGSINAFGALGLETRASDLTGVTDFNTLSVNSSGDLEFKDKGGTVTSLLGGGGGGPFDSEIVLTAGNGHAVAGGNSRKRIFSNIKINSGSDLSVSQSSTAGDFINVNTSGLYYIFYSDFSFTVTFDIGVCLNYTANGNVDTLSYPDCIGYVEGQPGEASSVQLTIFLEAGDSLNAQTDGNPNASFDNIANTFLVKRVG